MKTKAIFILCVFSTLIISCKKDSSSSGGGSTTSPVTVSIDNVNCNVKAWDYTSVGGPIVQALGCDLVSPSATVNGNFYGDTVGRYTSPKFELIYKENGNTYSPFGPFEGHITYIDEVNHEISVSFEGAVEYRGDRKYIRATFTKIKE